MCAIIALTYASANLLIDPKHRTFKTFFKQIILQTSTHSLWILPQLYDLNLIMEKNNREMGTKLLLKIASRNYIGTLTLC